MHENLFIAEYDKKRWFPNKYFKKLELLLEK